MSDRYSICPRCESAYTDSVKPGDRCGALVAGVSACQGICIEPADFVQLCWLEGRVEVLRQLVMRSRRDERGGDVFSGARQA